MHRGRLAQHLETGQKTEEVRRGRGGISRKDGMFCFFDLFIFLLSLLQQRRASCSSSPGVPACVGCEHAKPPNNAANEAGSARLGCVAGAGPLDGQRHFWHVSGAIESALLEHFEVPRLWLSYSL